jgi:hypothetical protein
MTWYNFYMIDLEGCARLLVTPGKGILAIDESESTADAKRLENNGVAAGAENRRRFRDLFLSAPGIEKYISRESFCTMRPCDKRATTASRFQNCYTIRELFRV